jgi:hypothetical protein
MLHRCITAARIDRPHEFFAAWRGQGLHHFVASWQRCYAIAATALARAVMPGARAVTPNNSSTHGVNAAAMVNWR